VFQKKEKKTLPTFTQMCESDESDYDEDELEITGK
jgi:hypothetical protein